MNIQTEVNGSYNETGDYVTRSMTFIDGDGQTVILNRMPDQKFSIISSLVDNPTPILSAETYEISDAIMNAYILLGVSSF